MNALRMMLAEYCLWVALWLAPKDEDGSLLVWAIHEYLKVAVKRERVRRAP